MEQILALIRRHPAPFRALGILLFTVGSVPVLLGIFLASRARGVPGKGVPRLDFSKLVEASPIPIAQSAMDFAIWGATAMLGVVLALTAKGAQKRDRRRR